MRGDLDETLARLARRVEASRRRAADRDDTTAPSSPPGLGGDTRNARSGRHAGVETASEVAGWGPVEEVAEAVRQVVGAYPGLAVTVQVEHAGRTYPMRVSWDGPAVTVGPVPPPTPVEPPPAWPLSGRTVPAWAPGPDGLTPDPAARLAELIRSDPTLLDELDPRR
ncbi:hypothetical protein PSH03_000798 [Micromonospora sp. PSH03]|uniref:hypothetical protein n=1 Tax=Micromonospora TaxID=1873 RepID=UPI001B363252|nr:MULTISPECIES: hypothetical protein [Micromonospora]MBQ0988991.1 hypothetical protein [Micromonospora sp. H61]MCG5455915.1 hypothetical protein [Micromonospora salmantinae]